MFFILRDETRRNNLIEHIRMLNISRPLSVEIKEYRKNRSNSQNRLYWSYLKVFSDFTGYTDEEMHTRFKVKFLGVVESMVEGKTLIQPRSTTKLTTSEFTDYIRMIELTAVQMGLSLPHHDDYSYAMNYPTSGAVGASESNLSAINPETGDRV